MDGRRAISSVSGRLPCFNPGVRDQSEKARVVKLKEEGARLDFLGFTFRYYDDLQGRGWRYLNVSPSEKALKKEREKLHEMTNHRQCFKPIPELIEGLNRHLKGWTNYFDFGYPRVAFREINRPGAPVTTGK